MSYRVSMNLLDANYPRLASLYDRMMSSARVVVPPRLIVTPTEATASALRDFDVIEICPTYLNRAPVPEVEATLGHECGHLLAGHGGTIFTPKDILRAHEQEADRLAVHFTGSHDAVIAMRADANRTVRDYWRPSNKLELLPGSLSEKVARTLDHLHIDKKRKGARHWASYVESYGTPEEMAANIRGVDLTDRNQFEALVQRRNLRTDIGRD